MFRIKMLLISYLIVVYPGMETIIPYPMHLEARVFMADLGQDMEIRIVPVQVEKNQSVKIVIYENDKVSQTVNTIGKEIINQKYYISAFTEENQVKQVKIIADYASDQMVAESKVTFNVYSPGYQTYTANNALVQRFTNNNSSVIQLDIYGSQSKVIEIKETVTIEGNPFIEIMNNRFLDFEDCKITGDNVEFNLDYCELRLYKKFEDTDIIFKENQYHSIELPLTKLTGNENGYSVSNEYAFYVSKTSGMVNQNYSSKTYQELVPFYIPYSIKDERIPYEIVFYDIGRNHSIFKYKGSIKVLNQGGAYFGQSYNYGYKQINKPLQGVNYV